MHVRALFTVPLSCIIYYVFLLNIVLLYVFLWVIWTLKDAYIFRGDSVYIEKAVGVALLNLMDYMMYFLDQKYLLGCQYENTAYHTFSQLFTVTANRSNMN